MKLRHHFLFACLSILFSALSVQAKNIKAYLMMSEFISVSQGNFVETYLSINSRSITYALNENKKYQANIRINITFSRHDSVFAYGKYNLLSPEYDDTISKKANFIDVQRFLLKPGDYTFDLSIVDNKNTQPQSFKFSQQVKVELNTQTPGFSSIELIDSYAKSEEKDNLSKNGYHIIPYVSSYFPESKNEILFYTEMYNSNRDIPDGENLVLNTFIETFESQIKLSDYFRFSKVKSSSVIPILNSLNISNLSSGNYNLVVEARDKENKLIADQRIFFQRNNPKAVTPETDMESVTVENSFVQKLNTDTLSEYIKYLYPISTRIEKDYADNVIKSNDVLKKKKYFLNFWQKRNSLSPEVAWNEYLQQVKEVNKMFKTQTRKGYATDRGRVYLQYGKPDSRLVYDREPSLYPYELWQYYKINQRSNRRFVFMNSDLVSNNYPLIHSDALGEVRDDRWQTRLNKRNTIYKSFDEEKANDQFGTNLRDAYDISR